MGASSSAEAGPLFFFVVGAGSIIAEDVIELRRCICILPTSRSKEMRNHILFRQIIDLIIRKKVIDAVKLSQALFPSYFSFSLLVFTPYRVLSLKLMQIK